MACKWPQGGVELMRATLGPGVGRVFLPRRGSHEHVAIERGALLLTDDVVPYRLKSSDRICYAGDCIHAFAKPNELQTCEYEQVMDVTGHPDSMRHRSVSRQIRR